MGKLTARPFLVFQGEAADAIDFYLSVFPDSEVFNVEHYAAGEAGREGTIKRARFSVAGQEVICTDSVVKQSFTFTPAFSFFIECPSEEQLRHLATVLKERGVELMPVGQYGFSKLFAWVNDRFGVSWQLNYT
jgi:predicted 3-demethylubiquinone-9 3-methyltransferase (glyoxalase superfamily)